MTTNKQTEEEQEQQWANWLDDAFAATVRRNDMFILNKLEELKQAIIERKANDTNI